MTRPTDSSLRSLNASAGTRPIAADGSSGLASLIHRRIFDDLVGKSHLSPEEQEIERLRELARPNSQRPGNPFPLIAKQWPELLVTDPADAVFFEGKIGDVLDPCLRLDGWQRQIIAAYFDDSLSEIAVKGCTKAGKGCSTSIAVNIWFDVFDQSRVYLSSARFDHAVDVIFGEVVMWRRRMKFPYPAKENAASISENERHSIHVSNPAAGESYSGQHGPRTLFIIDEASKVPQFFYVDAQKQASKIGIISNPRALSGWFVDLYKPCVNRDETQIVNGPFGKRLCVTVDGEKCLNVVHRRLERPNGPPGGIEISGRRFEHNDSIPPEFFAKVPILIPNQVDYGRLQGIKQNPDPRHVAVFAHGKFPMEDPEKQVIMASWLTFHQEAWNKNTPPAVESFGFDAARSEDGDFSVLAVGGQSGVRAIHRWKRANVMFHVEEILRIAKEVYGIDLKHGRHFISVDMDGGYGAGPYDRLKELGVNVLSYSGAARAEVSPGIYRNLRAEAYALLGRRLSPDDKWRTVPWALPHDDYLPEELCAPEKVYIGSDGLQFKLTPKRKNENSETSVEEKIGRSPDTGDAVVMLFHAVRRQFGLNQWFAAASAPLIMYPSAESVSARHEAARQIPPPAGSPKPAETTAEIPSLLRRLREQSGHLLEKPADVIVKPAEVAPPRKPSWRDRAFGD